MGGVGQSKNIQSITEEGMQVPNLCKQLSDVIIFQPVFFTKKRAVIKKTVTKRKAFTG